MNNDTSFWLGVAVAIPLSIVGTIAGNRLMPSVDAFFEKRKLTKFRRSKEQELANYKHIEAFRNGTRDKYPFYILLATSAVICAIGLASCLVLFFIKYNFLPLVVKYYGLPDLPNPLLLMAFVFGIVAVFFIAVIAATARQIERFEQYQAEIRKKWGEDAI